jgi:hypothetical protein
MIEFIDSALSRQKRQRYKGMWATDTVISQTIEEITSAGRRLRCLDQTFWEVSQTSNINTSERVDAILLYHMDQLTNSTSLCMSSVAAILIVLVTAPLTV